MGSPAKTAATTAAQTTATTTAARTLCISTQRSTATAYEAATCSPHLDEHKEVVSVAKSFILGEIDATQSNVLNTRTKFDMHSVFTDVSNVYTSVCDTSDRKR
jgi:hypothetical protein